MYQPIPVPFFKGVNYALPEDALGQGEVADADNFLFAKQQPTTRPGRDTQTVSGSVANPDFAISLVLEGIPYTLVVKGTSIYSLSAANVLTLLGTNAGFGVQQNTTIAAVNGIVLIGNNSGGVYRWDPIGATFTQLVTAPYRYFCSHTARAVAAYRLDGAAGAARNVGYSDQGDETNWTTNSAGQSILADAPDDITGLTTSKNVLIVCRRKGFHLGYPTGISLPPFRFEPWNREGVGVYYPDTMANSDNFILFAGEDDIYMTDLQSVTPIGKNVRDDLFPRMKSGIVYRGILVRQGFKGVRLQYHLHPMNLSLTNKLTQPHYIYDLYDDTWSKCSYNDAADIRFGLNRYQTLTKAGFAQMNTNGDIRHWDDSLVCDSPSSITLPTMMIGDLTKDMRVDRVMLKYRNHGITAGIRCRTFVDGQERALRSTLASRSLGTVEANGRWMRGWFDTDLNGMGVTVKFEVDAGVKCTANLALLRVQESAVFKGTMV